MSCSPIGSLFELLSLIGMLIAGRPARLTPTVQGSSRAIRERLSSWQNSRRLGAGRRVTGANRKSTLVKTWKMMGHLVELCTRRIWITCSRASA